MLAERCCVRMFRKKKKCNKKLLSQYPCDVYLKNALYFIENGKPDVAYTEICYAIAKSGGELSDSEFEKFCELRSKERNYDRQTSKTGTYG